MSNLCHLNIDIWFKLIDGHKWKQIIDDYLPRLRTFHLRTNDWNVFSEHNIQVKVNDLIDPFQSLFWIDERKWFVRCFTEDKTIHLDTLSNSPSYYDDDIFPDTWQSICPDDNQQKFYNYITSIYDQTAFGKRFLSNICLPNIDYLSIKLPINDRFWFIVPNLNQLKSLSLYFYISMHQWQVPNLLNRTYNLYTLRFSQHELLSFEMSLFNYRNTSVRKLDLHNYNHLFHEKECFLFEDLQSDLSISLSRARVRILISITILRSAL